MATANRYVPTKSPFEVQAGLRSYLEREFQAIARALNTSDRVFYVDDFPGGIAAAIEAAGGEGGGTIYFTPGATYNLDDGGTHSVVSPIQSPDFEDLTHDFTYNFLLDGLEHITFEFNGATLVSDYTAGHSGVFLLDGCRFITFRNGKIQGVHSHDSDASHTVLVPGMQGICATSQTRDSYGIRLENLDLSSLFTGFYAFGTSSPTNRVQRVTLADVRISNAEYAIALHENGDDTTTRYLASNVGRDCFLFGVKGFDLDIFSETGAGATHGLQALIKAYRNDTHSGRVRLRTTKQTAAAASAAFASEYDTDSQATPSRVRNVDLEVDNSDANDVAGVSFTVLEDSAFVTAATQVFDGITLRGIHRQIPDFSSTPIQDVDGSLDTDGVIVETGNIDDAYAGTGFVNPS